MRKIQANSRWLATTASLRWSFRIFHTDAAAAAAAVGISGISQHRAWLAVSRTAPQVAATARQTGNDVTSTHSSSSSNNNNNDDDNNNNSLSTTTGRRDNRTGDASRRVCRQTRSTVCAVSVFPFHADQIATDEGKN